MQFHQIDLAELERLVEVRKRANAAQVTIDAGTAARKRIKDRQPVIDEYKARWQKILEELDGESFRIDQPVPGDNAAVTHAEHAASKLEELKGENPLAFGIHFVQAGRGPLSEREQIALHSEDHLKLAAVDLAAAIRNAGPIGWGDITEEEFNLVSRGVAEGWPGCDLLPPRPEKYKTNPPYKQLNKSELRLQAEQLVYSWGSSDTRPFEEKLADAEQQIRYGQAAAAAGLTLEEFRKRLREAG